MSNNPLSVIDLMEQEYDVAVDDETTSGKRCFNELFEIEGDNNINIEKIKSMSHLYELGDSNNREELMYVENKIKKFISEMKNRVKEKTNREPKGYCFGSTFMNNKKSAWEYVDSIIDD